MAKIEGSYVKQANDTYLTLLTDEEGNVCVRSPTYGLPTQRYLTSLGNGVVSGGQQNLNGDYSSAYVDAFYLTDTIYDIHSALISVTDASKFNYNGYGGIVEGVITKGIMFYLYKASLGITIPLFPGRPIKKNYEWLELTSDTALTSFEGTPQTLKIEFNYVKDYGQTLRLFPGDKIIVRLNDNFTGLVSQTFGVRGIKQLQ